MPWLLPARPGGRVGTGSPTIAGVMLGAHPQNWGDLVREGMAREAAGETGMWVSPPVFGNVPSTAMPRAQARSTEKRQPLFKHSV